MNPVAEELLGWSLADIRHTPLGKVMRLVDEDSGIRWQIPSTVAWQSGEKIVGEGQKC